MPKVFKPTANAVSTGVRVFKPTENARGTGAVIVSPEKTQNHPLLQTPALKVWKGDISLQQGIKEAKQQEELRTTIPSRVYASDESIIGFDTLASDMSTLGKTVEGIYKGWQSKKTMDGTKPQVESMYNRLKTFQSYNEKFGDGSVDVSEQLNAYKSVLDDWDKITKGYGKYKNADEYNEAVKNAEEKLKTDELLRTANTANIETEINDLQKLKKKAEKIYKQWNVRSAGAKGDQKARVEKARDEEIRNVTGGYTFEELQKLISEKEQFKNKAKWTQKGVALSSVSNKDSKNYDKNFKKYVSSGIQAQLGEVSDMRNIIGKRALPEYTDAQVAFLLMKEHYGKGEIPEPLKNVLGDRLNTYRFMKDDEFELLAYYFGKDKETGKNQAEEYLYSIEEVLAERRAVEEFKKYKDKTFKEIMYGIPSGLNQYGTGIQNLSNDNEYIPLNYRQQLSGMIREDLKDNGPAWLAGTSLAQGAFDFLNTTSNMAPSILGSAVLNAVLPGTGAAFGAATMGASASGNAYQEKINLGWSKEDAKKYSIAVGVSEAGLSYALSGIGSLGGKLSGKTIKAISDGVEGALGKFVLTYGGKISSEVLEESLQEILNPVFENLALGYKENDFSDIEWQQVAYSAVMAALSAGLLEFKSSYNDSFKVSKTQENLFSTETNKKDYISLEEFSNSEATVWKNVDYNDNDTKTSLMQETHTRMVREGLVVKVSEDTQSQVGESFPDLRSMKKKERTSILKESMEKLKTNLRQFLNGFKNQDFEFSVNGKVLEATLYNTGINEVLEKITQKKANMLYSTEEIFKNAQYLYSTTDYSGDPNVYRWNYFYTPVQIGEETVGVRIAVRDIATPAESQIYNWGIKKDTSLDGEGRDNSRISQSVSSDVSNIKVPQKALGVKTIISNSDQNNTQADPNGPANFMPDGESEGEVGRADGEIADFGGIDTAKGKHLDKAQQDEITAIGEKLDRKVVYEDFYNLDKFKGKKKIPDGYLAKDGTVHINYYAKRPVYFLFKHEITHYLKRNLASYNDFMNLVIDSNAFKDWLNRNGYSSIDALKTEIMDTYSEVEGFDEERCYHEILANFVGEYLFGGENAISQKLINALEPKQKKTFREVINDIINYFKSKFQKNKPIQTEIDKIENEFIKVYKEAIEVEVDEGSSQATEEMYSISKTTNNVPVIVVNDDILRNVINEKELIDIVKKSLGKFKRVPIKGQNIYFVSDTKNEYLNSKYSQYLKKNQKQTYYDKMRLSSHPQDIVYATTNYINEGLNHPRKDNIIDFARGNILVDISGRKYSAEVVIGFTKSGICELHDIVKMLPTSFEYKKEATSESMDSNESTRSDVTSINKIPHKEDSVNNNFMLDSEDYSIPSTTNAESLLESYENGEISRQEYLNALRKEKTLNPLEIANLSERDADTTPEHAKKKGESKGNGESNTYNSLLESDIFDDTFKKEMKESSFVKKYATVTNEETLKTAAKELDEGGLNYVNKWWSIKPERASLIDTAVGFILMDRYQRIGDYQSAVAAAEKVREFGTASGQQVQIFSVLGRLDPNTMVVYAQKELSKAFDEMVKTRTQKWIDKNADKFNLTDNELEFIRRRTLQAAKLPEGRDKAIKLAEIATLLQDKLPPQKGEGLKTLQRMSMLLNAKTNIRNITGNGVMVPVFIFSDFFGSGIDKWVSTKTGVRTTGNFDVKSAKGLKKGAFETMDDFRRHVNTRNSEMNRFEIGSGKAFNEHHDGKFAKQLDEVAKVLNSLDRFTSFCLEMGDRPFYEMWFINSLNNQIKLNDVSEATPEMVAIASSEALQRTWQDTNKVVKAVAGTKNTLNYISIGGYGLGDVLIKFTKTPANLTKAIFDFSPAGLIKSIVSDGLTLRNAVKKGSFKPKMQKQFVDSLSKGITGTLLYILAASLASAGVLGGGGDEDKDVSDFEKYIQGIPEYSFKFAGKWWSYEWMQPVGAIAATVTDYMKSKENNPDNNFFENTLEAIKAGGEVLYNQSFMKSIQNLFTADNIVDGLIDAILDDPSVYVPQLLSQVANVTDKYRRTTYEKNKPLENALNRVKVKIPGLRQTLPKSVDVLGREIPNSQKGIFNAFFNPANTFTDTSTPVTDHVYELYTKTKNKTLMPRVAPYSITIKGITKNFTPEEKNDFQRISGATASDILEIAFKSYGYKKLSDEQKVEFINDVYGFATKMAKSSIEYDYTTLSAMVGEYSNGKPILSESDYKKLPEEAREMLAQQYFFNKTEIRFLNDYKGLINHYINQATE